MINAMNMLDGTMIKSMVSIILCQSHIIYTFCVPGYRKSKVFILAMACICLSLLRSIIYMIAAFV